MQCPRRGATLQAGAINEIVSCTSHRAKGTLILIPFWPTNDCGCSGTYDPDNANTPWRLTPRATSVCLSIIHRNNLRQLFIRCIIKRVEVFCFWNVIPLHFTDLYRYLSRRVIPKATKYSRWKSFLIKSDEELKVCCRGRHGRLVGYKPKIVGPAIFKRQPVKRKRCW